MNSGNYVPDRGDIIWLNFSPSKGREQSGNRPALVLSPKSYNHRCKLAIVCPITSQVKQLPFEVLLSGKIRGVVLCDQIKNISYSKRIIDYAETVPDKIVDEVAHKINLFLP